MSRIKYLLLPCLLLVIAGLIAANLEQHAISAKQLNELSGIAASRTNPGLYYVHNDSGGKPEVYVLDGKGKLVATLRLKDATNRDWEDIAIGPDASGKGNIVYVGEIGDNLGIHPSVAIYRFPEPVIRIIKGKPQIITLDHADKLSFRYDDGAKDAESLMVDSNGDMYIISKRESKVGVYLLRASAWGKDNAEATRIMSLSFPLAVAADISPHRDRIVIKNYTDVYSWHVDPGESIKDALSKEPVKLPYIHEPQGEALTISADEKSYLTISEQSGNKPVYLYRFPLINLK